MKNIKTEQQKKCTNPNIRKQNILKRNEKYKESNKKQMYKIQI